MKKCDNQDQKSLATWAADCAERVLPLFENAHSDDDRPRKAIETCRTWVRTGEFKMTVIRGASLSAHTAAREAKENSACFAARAAGQAVATAHVPQDAFGAAYYALKAIGAADPVRAEYRVAEEFDWQTQHAPENLREELFKRVILQKNDNKVTIKIRNGKDF
jgi:hypothetical protein